MCGKNIIEQNMKCSRIFFHPDAVREDLNHIIRELQKILDI